MDLVCKYCGSNACVKRYRSRVIILNCVLCGLPTYVWRKRTWPRFKKPSQPDLLQLPLPLDSAVA